MTYEVGQSTWEIGDRPLPPPNALPAPVEVAEIWPSPIPAADFNLSSIDVYTNTDCPFMCDQCFLTTEELKTKDQMSIELIAEIVQWAVQPGSKIEEITLLGGRVFCASAGCRYCKTHWQHAASRRIIFASTHSY